MKRRFGEEVMIFIAGLFIGFTESIVSSKGVRDFALYSKRFSGVLLTLSGLYIGIVNF